MNREVAKGMAVFGFGMLGLIIAGIQQLLYDSGYLIDEFVSASITLPDIQIVTIVFALLCGTVFAVVMK